MTTMTRSRLGSKRMGKFKLFFVHMQPAPAPTPAHAQAHFHGKRARQGTWTVGEAVGRVDWEAGRWGSVGIGER